MKKIAIILCVVFLFLSINAGAVTLQKPAINAQGSVLMDLNSGKILLDKNSHNKYAPASTTKVMTALLTLEKCKLDEKVMVSKNAAYADGSKIYLLEGEEVTVEQLLYAMLLESANDAAVALAEHISGSTEAFAKLMNERALELGCTDTHFVNPNGLYDKNHYTSAYDLALIAAKAMEIPKFRQMVSTQSHNILPTNKQSKTRYLHNHNKLLSEKGYKYSGADGIKTGYTVKSKHTYVGSATRNGRTLMVTFLYDEKGYYKEAANLFDYGFKSFSDVKILSKDVIVKSIKLKGSSEEIPVYPEKDFYLTIPKGINPNISKKIIIKDSLSKVNKGDIIGTMEISSASNNKTSVNLIAGKNYVSTAYSILPKGNVIFNKIFKLKNLIYPLGVIFFIFLFRGFYRKYKRKRRLFY